MSRAQPWTVHKFGGTSVADAECFRRVADIVEAQPAEPVAVVLSACKGVTNALLEVVAHAETNEDASQDLAALRARHAAIAEGVLPAKAARAYLADLDADLRDLEGVLHSVRLTRSAAQNVRDLIAGYGELWSSRLFAAALVARGGDATWIDARRVLVVDWGPLGPAVDWARSRANLNAVLAGDVGRVLVITGYVASDRKGAQTTLGRNGSDYSASIFGALLKVRQIVIWTDVDGVLSADPRRVPDATVIDQLSYNEAMELAYFGANVLHPQTMAPAVSSDIPIWIRNTFAPERPGTLITARPSSSLPVKGLTSIDEVALVNLEGAGMIGVPGTAHRLFGALKEAGVSVILISQGSSEHSICCAVPDDQAERAAAVVRSAFERELKEGQIQSVGLDRALAILAAVGDGMAGTPGIAAKLFGTLSAAHINVRAIAQGSSERNISIVVDGQSATRALRAAHAGFYLSPNTLSIGVIGPGAVGGAFLDQLAAQSARLEEQFNVHLRVRGILSSKRMLLSEGGVNLANWAYEFEQHGAPADMDRFFEHVRMEHMPHNVVVDCSASEAVGARYRDLFTRGVHVITPNKKANSANFDYYKAMREARRASGAHYLYEATVGAGLPIIQTARDLRETGDDIACIEGIFSGTLAYLFNVYVGERAFSEIVVEACERGYTEPDPRDDLSGADVARKLTILGREMGLTLEVANVAVESLVPADLETGSIEDFLKKLPRYDRAMRERFEGARARGKVLRHVGRVTADGGAAVGVMEVDAKHAFANIALTDNMVRFQTRRYCDNPLIVQGPGAGPEVTAGGVFADLLRLASYLGARM